MCDFDIFAIFPSRRRRCKMDLFRLLIALTFMLPSTYGKCVYFGLIRFVNFNRFVLLKKCFELCRRLSRAQILMGSSKSGVIFWTRICILVVSSKIALGAGFRPPRRTLPKRRFLLIKNELKLSKKSFDVTIL